MQEPTSNYGCGSLECISCSGDKEWQMEAERKFLEDEIEDLCDQLEDALAGYRNRAYAGGIRSMYRADAEAIQDRIHEAEMELEMLREEYEDA